LLGEIVYIPRNCLAKDMTKRTNHVEFLNDSSSPKKNSLPYIPCLFLPYSGGSSKVLMYFHGNAEDIGLSYEMLDHLRAALKVNILAVEYPNYGIYKDIEGCTAEKIKDDAVYIY
jgi:hypothetical protein